MSKDALIDQIAKDTGMSKKDAGQALNSVINGIGSLLSAGQEISLIGFGKFTVKETAERTGRNPQTGEPMIIKAKRQVKFTPGKQLKEIVQK